MKNPIIQDLGVIAICVALCAGLALAYSSTRTPVSPSEAFIVLSEVRTPNLTASPQTGAPSRLGDEVLRARSANVFDRAATSLAIPVDELRNTVSIRSDDDATAIVITGMAPQLARSVERANAIAAAYETEVRDSFSANSNLVLTELDELRTSDQNRLAEIQAQIDQIDTALKAEASENSEGVAAETNLFRTLSLTNAERAELSSEASATTNEIRAAEARIEQIEAEQRLFNGGISFSTRAERQSAPTEPQTTRNVALGAFAGLLVGLGIAWSFADSSGRR